MKVIRGGETRTESVMAGALEADPRAELIAVHDGARPLITPELFDAVVESAGVTGASAPAVPVSPAAASWISGRTRTESCALHRSGGPSLRCRRPRYFRRSF